MRLKEKFEKEVLECGCFYPLNENYGIDIIIFR